MAVDQRLFPLLTIKVNMNPAAPANKKYRIFSFMATIPLFPFVHCVW
ncbi:hypothetical protein E6C60_2484 [Paenibacillus algicola]|uniref:Uncharacterized protein n=1 Tax=Paenibacillus algicola TaxID=2565926 RepID=A0A4P8XKG6_9BACL|nr:hypothetical protein E6C60_2484 [Paenibacillus algicola]